MLLSTPSTSTHRQRKSTTINSLTFRVRHCIFVEFYKKVGKTLTRKNLSEPRKTMSIDPYIKEIIITRLRYLWIRRPFLNFFCSICWAWTIRHENFHVISKHGGTILLNHYFGHTLHELSHIYSRIDNYWGNIPRQLCEVWSIFPKTHVLLAKAV